jgi:hypothetical protein
MREAKGARMEQESKGGWAARDAFLAERGWKESSSPYLCVRQVAGKRCRRHGPNACVPGCGSPGDEHGSTQTLLDHAQLCVAGDGAHVIVAEPYGIETQQDDLAALRSVAAELGLVVEEYPELSVWCPPHTTLLLIRPEGVQV